ncbi:VanZ family protein [Gottfriedia acidiceleris]|uniref:VanZ family protein n=1 Tax=Gottfriedia acidiceleris TaxID=371036 RepID=UPI000B442D28|nr:VanZ family protein [Gottfriedia acidiceleris]
MESKSRIRIFIGYWIPVILIAGIIFYSSATPYEKQDIRPEISHLTFLYNLMKHFTFVDFSYAGHVVSIKELGVAGFTEFFIRKLSHFSIYLLLAYFATRLAKLYVKNSFFVGVIFSILYAASDEFHQSFTANRTPLVHDVVIDSIGALIGACLFLLINKKLKAKVQKAIRV